MDTRAWVIYATASSTENPDVHFDSIFRYFIIVFEMRSYQDISFLTYRWLFKIIFWLMQTSQRRIISDKYA